MRLLILLTCLALAATFAAAQRTDRPALVIVLVIDGLRPDSISPALTPNLNRLKTAGVWYTRSHSVFPTVTRVNATSITTGTSPARHRMVSNSFYVPAISNTVLSNADYRNLLSLGKWNGGRVVDPKSLGEYFQAAGIDYVAVSSGSTGSALLLNPTAPYGNGSLINPGFENGKRVAFPDALNLALLNRFGAVNGEEGDESMIWVERVLREYVLDAARPQVIVDWMGRTDSAQHEFGVGSQQGLAAVRLVDQQIGLLLERLRQLKLEDKTDIIVTCDHGFDHEPAADVLAPVRESGFAAGDVVVDNQGGSSLFYVKNRDPEKITRLAAKFQESPTTNAIFVAARRPDGGAMRCSPGAVKGFAPGTFALELASQCVPSIGPDLIVTYGWNDAPNPFGVPGTQWGPGATGASPRNGHGGLNPYVTHSTLIGFGKSFAQGKTVDVPAGNQDIAPTLLAIQGLPMPGGLDGRVLAEAFKNSRKSPLKSKVRRIQMSTGAYCAEVEISYAANHAYLNQARRCPGKR